MTSPILPATGGFASVAVNDALATAEAPPDAVNADGAQPDRAGADSLARFALYDLPPSLQKFAWSAPGEGSNGAILLAPQADGHDTAGPGQRLYGGIFPQVVQAQQIAAPLPAVPGTPIDLRRMEAMNATVQGFNMRRSPIAAADLQAVQQTFQAATDALRAGDYKAAQQELGKLGFPLPPLSSGQPLATETLIAAHMLGVPAQQTRNGWSVHVTFGARGNQAVNDLNGFAANARMIDRMSSAPGGVSNPPTETQTMQYMRDFAQPAQGTPRPSAQDVMQAASEITDGSIVHYSSAGARDPRYGPNPSPHAFYRDRQGNVHEFDSPADARAAAQAGNPPMARRGQITTMHARSPDEWSDITSQGTRAGRHVGDCESKLYLQTRVLTEAGFTSLGSIDVRPGNGGIGHMFGAFRAADGTTWVTSNEEFRQVTGSGPQGAVTQADLDATLHELTADVYHVRPNRAGVRDTSGFTFSAAATAIQTGTHPAVDTIRRCVELGMMGRSEALIPPPAVNPPSGYPHQSTAP